MHPDDPAVAAQTIDLPADPPTLFVVVDTEEEFDWSAPFSRGNTCVTAMRQIGRAQTIFDRFKIVPTYVVSYPVAHQPSGAEPLREFADGGRATIGAHLHPWVTPPFVETISNAHSYACNLEPAVEGAKLQSLVEAVTHAFGSRPTVYKAGRYGLAARSLTSLIGHGINIDVSVMPHVDFTPAKGPDFSEFDARPRWMAHGRLLEIPCTAGLIGAAGPTLGAWLHRLASARPWSALRAPGVLARTRIANRIVLSPEGNSLGEMTRLTRALLARGVRTFTMTFHSPSVEAGHTPYVRTRADLQLFLRKIERYCEFFFGELGGMTSTPLAFRARMLARGH
jgi:hypothetical protein